MNDCKISLFLIVIAFVSKSANLDITVQSAWNTNGTHLIYSAGALFKSDKIPFTYYEFGIISLPRLYKRSSEYLPPVNEKLYSFYGIYGGYYIALMPIFRPGILLGTVLEQNALYSDRSLHPYEIKKIGINYYAGLSIQLLFLTFQITNYGIGGGINLPLRY